MERIGFVFREPTPRASSHQHEASTSRGRGYLKPCRDCDAPIFMARHNGRWGAYESWWAGNAAEGEWVRHACVRAGES